MALPPVQAGEQIRLRCHRLPALAIDGRLDTKTGGRVGDHGAERRLTCAIGRIWPRSSSNHSPGRVGAVQRVHVWRS